jgi:hypothetical protein
MLYEGTSHYVQGISESILNSMACFPPQDFLTSHQQKEARSLKSEILENCCYLPSVL